MRATFRDVDDYVFFFSSRRRHTRFDCDWSSDVCSSDLIPGKCGNGYRGSRGAAIREISFEDFVHAIVVVDLGQINGELKNAVHGAAAGLEIGRASCRERV